MEREIEVMTEREIAQISRCIRAVLARKFPGLSRADREDIEQDVMVKLARMARDGKNIDHPASYLWRVATTTALDCLEAKGRAVSLESYLEKAGPGGMPEDLLVSSAQGEVEGRRHLESLLTGLPRRRSIVLKLHLAGLGLEETAAYLGWTQAKVRHLLYRGLGQLRRAARDLRRKSEERGHEPLPVAARDREGLPD
jgi:RNA polymerase sigma factor (sigma-70 family)